MCMSKAYMQKTYDGEEEYIIQQKNQIFLKYNKSLLISSKTLSEMLFLYWPEFLFYLLEQ